MAPLIVPDADMNRILQAGVLVFLTVAASAAELQERLRAIETEKAWTEADAKAWWESALS